MDNAGLTDSVPMLEEVPSVMKNIVTQRTKNVNVPKQKKSTFGGFQKGFLCGNPTKPTSSNVKPKDGNDIPYIKGQPKHSNLRIPEVQKAMSSDFDVNSFQNDLSSKIQASPDISHVLSDPHWLGILEEFQLDATAAMKKYENNKTVKNTMIKLCGTFGDSFLHMMPSGMSEDDQLMKMLMENPKVKEALTDEFIIKLMDYQKAGKNDIVHRMMVEGNNTQKSHIQTLIDHGLFSFIS